MSVLVVLALGVGIAFLPNGSTPTSRLEPAEPRRTADASASDAGVAPAPGSPASPIPSSARTSTPTSPRPVSASAPPGCPDDEADDPDFVRPSVWELLRLRTQELRDRLPQLSRDASPELRAGLRGLGGEDEARALDLLHAAPDRVRDGFDIAIAARLNLGMRALGARDLRAARLHASRAVREAPDDAMAHALAALVAGEEDDPEAARESMARAFALASDEPALALASARREADAGRFDAAASAALAYLTAVPADARIRSWRDRIVTRAELTRAHIATSRWGIHILYPREWLSDERARTVLDLVRRTLDDVARRLGKSPRTALAVVVYANRDDMRRATCTPSWTGAVYDGVLHLDAQTLAREEIAGRVVRHEATHAQLASVRGALPHWLNEGIAQWMEGPPSEAARRSWRRMVERRFWIPFASIEGGLLVIDDARDAELAYHQSLAMVTYLVHRRGERVFAEAIEHVENGRTEDLVERLVPARARGEDLLAFLASELAP